MNIYLKGGLIIYFLFEVRIVEKVELRFNMSTDKREDPLLLHMFKPFLSDIKNKTKSGKYHTILYKEGLLSKSPIMYIYIYVCVKY